MVFLAVHNTAVPQVQGHTAQASTRRRRPAFLTLPGGSFRWSLDERLRLLGAEEIFAILALAAVEVGLLPAAVGVEDALADRRRVAASTGAALKGLLREHRAPF